MFFSDADLFSRRPVPGRRADGEGEAPDHADGGRPAPREPAVHPVRGQLVGRRQAVRVRRRRAAAGPCSDRTMSSRGRIEREIKLPQLGEILNPSWSPDGTTIVFSALVGGLTDLFVYDLEADSLAPPDRTTPTPICSRPGRPTARASRSSTDRFTTRLERPRDRAVSRSRSSTAPAARDQPRCRASRARSTSTRSGRRTAPACTSSPIPTASPTSTACGWPTASCARSPTCSPASAASPRPVPPSAWRSGAAAWSTACSGPTATSSTPSIGARRWPGRRAAASRAGVARPLLPPAGRAESRSSSQAAAATRRPACRPTPTFADRALPAEALAHLRRAAVPGGRVERVRDLRRRRRVALLQRRARQPQPDHRPPGERRSQGHHRRRGLPEHEPPAQLGRRGPAGALSHRRLRRRGSRRSTASRSRRAGAAAAADQPRPPGPRLVSVQHGAAARAVRRLHQHLVRQRAPDARASPRSPASRCSTRRTTCPPAARSTSGSASAALVYDNSLLRRHRADPGPALPARGEPDVRVARFRRRAGRLPPVLHAGPAGHSGRAAAALRPLRIRRRGLPAPAAVPRLPRAGARLRARLVRCLRVPPGGRRSERLPGVRPAARQPHGRGQPRASLPAVRRAGYRLGLLRRAPDRLHRVRRRRRRLGHERLSPRSRVAPGRRSSAPAPVCGSTCSASPSPSSTWSSRSSGRTRDGSGS